MPREFTAVGFAIRLDGLLQLLDGDLEVSGGALVTGFHFGELTVHFSLDLGELTRGRAERQDRRIALVMCLGRRLSRGL